MTNHQPSTGLDESLQKITKGAGIAFLGAGAGMGLAFLNRVLVARIGTETEYGIFSLAFVVFNICAVIGTVGLQQGAPRMIAFARGEGNEEKVKYLIPASIQLGLLASILIAATLFFTADLLADNVFHEDSLSHPVRIVAFGIPFFVMINVLASIFRGFDNVKPKAYFLDLLRNLLFCAFLVPFIFMDWQFDSIFYAFVGSFGVAAIGLAVYTFKYLPVRISLMVTHKTRELLVFSLPLVAITMLQMIIIWTDTLMLGGFKTTVEVGMYNAAHPIAQFLQFPLATMGLIYVPVISGLYAQSSVIEIRRNFIVLTKWVCWITFPLFLILFIHPDTVLSFLFGGSYSEASDALRILSFGFMVHTLMGPNGATLIAMGRNQFVMWTTLATATLNIILNIVLIPRFGIEGAAIASMAALVSTNAIVSYKLYYVSKIHPLGRSLMKPIVLALALVFVTQLILGTFVEVEGWMLPFLMVLYYCVFGLSVLFTRSFTDEDIALLEMIGKRTGINTSPLRAVINRFL